MKKTKQNMKTGVAESRIGYEHVSMRLARQLNFQISGKAKDNGRVLAGVATSRISH